MMSEIPRKFKHKIFFEKQSTNYTCGAKALQLILNYLDPRRFPLGKEMELEIFEEISHSFKKATSPPAIVWYAAKNGFRVLYVAQTEKLFKYPEDPRKYIGYIMPKEEFERSLEEDLEWFEMARKEGAELEIVKEVGTDYLKKKLIEIGPAFAMIDEFGILHAIVIRGFENNLFLTVDPISGYQRYHFEELKELLETRYGICLVFIGKNSENIYTKKSIKLSEPNKISSAFD